jgi:hypothetical protein
MEIKINNKVLDVSLDNENTLGDVLAGLEQWLSGSGHRISELFIDGKFIDASMIEDIFAKEIKNIKTIEINTNVVAELTAASLINLLEDINEYEKLNFEEKSQFYVNWKDSVTAKYIHGEIADLYSYCVNTFYKGEMAVQTLRSITEEIQREVNEPVNEIKTLEPVLNEICERLINLPLDIQTGKDLAAANTIQIFSAITEKIFRIYRQLDTQGYLLPSDEKQKPLSSLITGFGNLLKELLEAYEKNDSVLVGDLTEYEASPKLKELYTSIIKNINYNAELQIKKYAGEK